MLETKCLGDNFEILVTVLVVFVTNILYLLTYASCSNIQKDVTDIEILSPSSMNRNLSLKRTCNFYWNGGNSFPSLRHVWFNHVTFQNWKFLNVNFRMRLEHDLYLSRPVHRNQCPLLGHYFEQIVQIFFIWFSISIFQSELERYFVFSF